VSFNNNGGHVMKFMGTPMLLPGQSIALKIKMLWSLAQSSRAKEMEWLTLWRRSCCTYVRNCSQSTHVHIPTEANASNSNKRTGN
jgi:hypothetical protein